MINTNDVAHVSEQHIRTRPKKIRRRCCVKNCQGNDTNSSMFTFPNTQTVINGVKCLNEVQVERCTVWLNNIADPDLNSYNLADLYKNFFLCNNHFDSEQFSSESKKYLKRNAIPNVFSIPLSGSGQVEVAGNGSGQRIPTLEPVLLDISNALQIDIIGPGTSYDSSGKRFTTFESVFIKVPDSVLTTSMGPGTSYDSILTNSHAYHHPNVARSPTIEQRQFDWTTDCAQTNTNSNEHDNGVCVKQTCIKRRCCASQCKNNNLNSHLFSFPSVVKGGELCDNYLDQINRCQAWLRNCGDKNLAQKYNLFSGSLVLCDKHFTTDQFTTAKRNKLKKTAVPTQFDNAQFDNDEDGLILNRKLLEQCRGFVTRPIETDDWILGVTGC